MCQGLLPTIRHLENRRGEGPGDEVDPFSITFTKKFVNLNWLWKKNTTWKQTKRKYRRRISLQCRRFPCVQKLSWSSRFVSILSQENWAGRGLGRIGSTLQDQMLRLPGFLHSSFQISLWWPIHIINPVEKTKLSCYTSQRRSTTVSLETCPLYSYIGETGRNLNTRLTEHKWATRNGDVNNHTAVHHQLTNHNIHWDTAQCLTFSTNYFQRLTLESWYTNLE